MRVEMLISRRWRDMRLFRGGRGRGEAANPAKGEVDAKPAPDWLESAIRKSSHAAGSGLAWYSRYLSMAGPATPRTQGRSQTIVHC